MSNFFVQISSGHGPAECERGVWLLARALLREFPELSVKVERAGRLAQTASSVTLVGDGDYRALAGTVEWIAKSPFRPHHRRRNWFLDVTVLPEMQPIPDAPEYAVAYFHCGGNGGQNVNKVETGVRLTHVPTGLTVTATEERTQQANRRHALAKLQALLAEGRQAQQRQQDERLWRSHQRLERGNPIRVYEGAAFTRKK